MTASPSCDHPDTPSPTPSRSSTADLLKDTAVVLMIEVHLIELFAQPSVLAGWVGRFPLLLGGLLALVAVAVSPLVLEPTLTLLGTYGIPPFTLPFCLVTLGAVYALRAAHYPLLSSGFGGSPEEVRENSLVSRQRYPGSLRSLGAGCGAARPSAA